jgi:2-haloacid dehalogenase
VLDELLRERAHDAIPEEGLAPLASARLLSGSPGGLRSPQNRYVCISFMILGVSLISDVLRHTGIVCDAVISCETPRVYNPRREAHRDAARLLQANPTQMLIVACHNFDLDAARAEGFRTAFVPPP